MPESFKNKRVVMALGQQRLFITKAEETLGIQKMATLCTCSERTIRDWKRERFRISAMALEVLAASAHIPLPTHRLEDAYAHTAKAGKKGFAAVMNKYGQRPYSEGQRKNGWEKWWEETGRFKKTTICRPLVVCKPKRDESLAEFVGIMMGDGGLSTYQATVSLNQVTDAEFSVYVSTQIEKLFGVAPAIYDRQEKLLRTIVVSRRELVHYLHTLGLPIGNKIRQGLDIPPWIKGNQQFLIACIRGLVDTDGSVFTHRYTVKEKLYAYKKLSFTSASSSLRSSVYASLKALGMKPRLGRVQDVRLDSAQDLKRYFAVVGTNNPKHLKRYESALG